MSGASNLDRVRPDVVAAERVALVAVHSWKTHGARAAMFAAGGCAGLAGAPTAAFRPADIGAAFLAEVVGGLASLPARMRRIERDLGGRRAVGASPMTTRTTHRLGPQRPCQPELSRVKL